MAAPLPGGELLARVRGSTPQQFQDPPVTRFLFGHTSLAWLWLLLRVWLGWQWLQAGEHKLTDPKWMQTGEALKGFWERAVALPQPPARPLITYDWYRDFLTFLLQGEHYTWFAKLVAVGEVLVGIGLIVGAFVGIAACFGGLMNWSFMMAGTTSSNPFLFVVALVLILAWKTAGWWGLDRVLLPALGTPWRPGAVFPPRAPAPAPAPGHPPVERPAPAG